MSLFPSTCLFSVLHFSGINLHCISICISFRFQLFPPIFITFSFDVRIHASIQEISLFIYIMMLLFEIVRVFCSREMSILINLSRRAVIPSLKTGLSCSLFIISASSFSSALFIIHILLHYRAS